ncbi:MAG: insulinase family protein [Treponema sp.]|jgi:zinc protease|nr:insulinase family protein [Treponema sp.]
MDHTINIRTRKIAGIILSLALAAGVFACATSSKIGNDVYGGLGLPTDPTPFMAVARTGVLPNGLRYYILENAKPENRAYLTLGVNAGSVLETEDERGLAHFTEHMAFNGTTNFPEQELVGYLRSLGMRFGPDVNAYTTYDATVFGIEVPVEDDGGVKRIPGKALAILDDWTHAITFAPKDVDDERPVIMEEYRSRLGAMERIRRQLLPILFQGSPYADRNPIGLPDIIEHAPASRLEQFYKTWYRPDNMALIIVGDFDGAVLEAELAGHFSAPAPETPLNRPVYDLPGPKKRTLQVEIFTDPELPYSMVNCYYKRTPKPVTGNLASYREGVIDGLIDQMLSLRFDDAAAKPEAPYIGAGGNMMRYGAASRYYVLAAQAKAGSVEETLREILREKESMSRYGFTETEIDQAKRSLVSDIERMVSEKDRQNSNAYIRNFTAHFLRGGGVLDIEWELMAIQKLLPGISAKDIAAEVQHYFAEDDLSIFVLAPESEVLPSKEGIRRLVTEARKAKIAPPAVTALSAELLEKAPEPGVIVAESVDSETGAVHWELGNGAEIILKDTKNRNNEVILYALARGGTTSAPVSEDISVTLAAEMLNASGLGRYTHQELIKKLADKQVSISFWTSSFLRGFQGSATTGDLKTLFELLYLSFTQPRIDEDTVKVMVDQYRTSLAQRGEAPQSVFSDEITKIVYGNNPRFKPLELADLSRVSRGEALAFIQQAHNPADYTFVFTGNLDIQALRSYIETYLASIPRGQTWNTWADPHIIRPGKTTKNVYKGKEAQSLVFMGWFEAMDYSEPDGAAAAVLQEYLDIKLIDEIREKQGGVYSVSASVSLSPFPPAGELSMTVYFGCDPKRAVELSAAITDEIGRVEQGTIDADAFKKAQEAIKKTYEQSMQSNTYIARNYATLSLIYEQPLNRLNQRPDVYDAVTPDALQRIMKRLLPQGPMVGILYPEGWTK